MPVAEITQLITYPIKSCAGIQHQTIELSEFGLAGDRHWMLVDDKGVFLSQRKHPQMALIQPQIQQHALTINAPGMYTLTVNLEHLQKPVTITVWQDTFLAQTLSETANQWFSDYLGFAVRLVQHTDISHRLIDPNYSQNNQPVAFADGFPILLTHEASLSELNQQLSQAVDMNRFRPNLVVSSDFTAWDELKWSQLFTCDFLLDLVKPCSRCVITGVEQSTGQQTGTEVLKILRQKFPHQDKAVFGINAIPKMFTRHNVALKVGTVLDVQHNPG